MTAVERSIHGRVASLHAIFFSSFSTDTEEPITWHTMPAVPSIPTPRRDVHGVLL
jgi:hypothetical protein